jgi:Cephalosporin hydroxylase
MLYHENPLPTTSQPGYPGLGVICQHLETLTRLGTECPIIAEFGSFYGVSSIALLTSKPKKFISVDIKHTDFMINLTKLRLSTELVLLNKNTLDVKLEEVDLLFIDSFHTYSQIKEELRLHHASVKKYIIMHDTTIFEFSDEKNIYNLPVIPNDKKGLWPAIREFLQEHHEWEVAERYVHNMGLTVLRRC